jgi:predicted  nucleic acid-binding Zn-ribbon protein
VYLIYIKSAAKYFLNRQKREEIMKKRNNKLQNISISVVLASAAILSFNSSSQAAVFTTNFVQTSGVEGDVELKSITQNNQTFNNFVGIRKVQVDWKKTTKIDPTKGTKSNPEIGKGTINNTGSLSIEKTDKSTSNIDVSGIKDPTNQQIKEVLNDKYLSTFLDGEDTGFFSMKLFFKKAISQDNLGLDNLFLWERGMNSDLHIAAINNKGDVIGESVKLERQGGLIKEKTDLGNLQKASTKLESKDIPTAKTQVATTQATVTNLKNQVATLTSQIPTMEANVSKYDSQVQQATKDISNYQSQVQQATKDVSNYQSQVTSLKAQLAAKGLSTTTKNQLNAQLNTANTNLTAANTQLKTANINLTAANNQLKTANINLTAANKTMTTTKTSLTSTQTALQAKNITLDTQTTSLQLLESQLKTTQSQIETAKTDISNREIADAGFSIDSQEIDGAQKVGSWGVSLKQLGVNNFFGVRLEGYGSIDNGADIVGIAVRGKGAEMVKAVPESSNLLGLAVVGGVVYLYRRDKSRKMSLLKFPR